MTSSTGHRAGSLREPPAGSSGSDVPVAADTELAKAIARLRSLHDGDVGVIDVVACGARAIPALRDILVTREPSGLYETRRRAVEALAQLRAFDVLKRYLETPCTIDDPIELTGEEAVINAAARALPRAKDPAVAGLLLALAERKPLAGVVDALGELCCAEALPCFMRALAEDFTRPAAEAAIRRLGPSAQQALLDGAMRRLPLDRYEPESSRRFRRSALRLYAELMPVPHDWLIIRELAGDEDREVAVAACELCLRGPSEPAKVAAVLRLVELLGDAGWMLREKIETCLVDHFDKAGSIVEDVARFTEALGDLDAARARRVHALRRVMARGSREPAPP